MSKQTKNICPNCEGNNPENAENCNFCGKKLINKEKQEYDYSDQFAEKSEWHTQAREVYHSKLEDLLPFIGKNSHYYLSVLMRLKLTGRKIYVNFSAAFFPFAWFAYRKMYLYSFAATVFYFIAAFFPQLSIYAIVPPMLFSGLFGNFLYMRSLEEKSKAYKRLAHPDEKRAYMKKHGGESENASILILGGYLMVTFTALAIIAAYRIANEGFF